MATELSKDEYRFWRKVRIGDSCWEWTASTNNKGYGLFGLGGMMRSAHRTAWTMTKGAIPKGVCVLHKCDNRLCVRPSHLFQGSVADNQRDMAEKGRSARGERNIHAKLTEEQVLEIRASSETQDALAARYGVSQPLVSEIRSRKKWGWLND